MGLFCSAGVGEGGDSCAVRCDHPTGVYETRPGGCQVIQTTKHTQTHSPEPELASFFCVVTSSLFYRLSSLFGS